MKHHINKIKDKDHIIRCIKTLDKIQYPFYNKNSQQSGYKGNIPQPKGQI